MSIDRSRAYLKKTTRRGAGIYQFEDEPGTYRNEHGDPVDDAEAGEAGFDVASGKRARRRRELEAEAKKQVDIQMLEADEAIEVKLAEEAGEAPPIPHIEKTGRKWSVIDAAGNETAGDLTKKEASDLLDEVRQQ